MIKKLLFVFLLLINTLYAEYDRQLDDYTQGRALYEKASIGDVDAQFDLGLLYRKQVKDYDKAVFWYEKAYKSGSSRAAFNLGNMYDDIKKYDKAEEWYKKAIDEDIKEASLNLGLLYKKLQRYDDAIFYYTKAYQQELQQGANALGYLFEHNLHNNNKAEQWYKKAVQSNNQKAIGNLAKLYHKQNKTELGSAYLISLIDNGYSKEKVLAYLKTKWNLTDKEIKQAYQLQKTLDIPKHYYNPELEVKPIKKKTSRR